MKAKQMLEEDLSRYDLRAAQDVYIQYKPDLPISFTEYVSRCKNLKTFIHEAYAILVRERPEWRADHIRKILQYVGTVELDYAPSTMQKALSGLPIINPEKIKAGRKGAWLANKAKKNRKEFLSISSRGGEAGSREDRQMAARASYKTKREQEAFEMKGEPTVGSKAFNDDVANSPMTSTCELRMEVNKQWRARLNMAMEEAVKQARREKKTPFIGFIGPTDGEVTKIAPRVA